MNRQRLIIIAGALACALLLASSALAMESANYKLDWFTPLTGNAGGAVGSANYAVNFTFGQSVIGTSSGAGYAGCLGYWCSEGGGGGPTDEYRIYLPLVLRNQS